jgi:hypothetical protein
MFAPCQVCLTYSMLKTKAVTITKREILALLPKIRLCRKDFQDQILLPIGPVVSCKARTFYKIGQTKKN